MHAAKLENLILYLGQHRGVTDFGETKLNKLAYFIDALHMREYGESITGSEFIKYQQGPVPSRGAKILKALKRQNKIDTQNRKLGSFILAEILPKAEPDLTVFSSEEMKTIEMVVKTYGKKSAKSLSELSHKEPSWRYAELRSKLNPELMHYGAQEDPIGL